MRKANIILAISAVILSIITVSCETLKQIGYAPEIKMEAVAIEKLDLEGITFNCKYSISNPYPLDFSVMSVNADVLSDTISYAKLKADEGVTIEACDSKENEFSFLIPYSSILSLAANLKDKKSLPFTIEGNASLDLSSIPLADISTMTIPFSTSFEVPVFKPSFSVSNPQLHLPTLEELKNSLINNGVGLTKAVSIASQILSGKSISESLLSNLNLDLNFTFDVNVTNQGSASWEYVLEDCSLTTASGKLADLTLSGSNTYTDSKCVIPVTAKLNTVNAGKFIAQIINKSGTDPVFSLDSSLTFTDLSYAKGIPLDYSCTVPLSRITQVKAGSTM